MTERGTSTNIDVLLDFGSESKASLRQSMLLINGSSQSEPGFSLSSFKQIVWRCVGLLCSVGHCCSQAQLLLTTDISYRELANSWKHASHALWTAEFLRFPKANWCVTGHFEESLPLTHYSLIQVKLAKSANIFIVKRHTIIVFMYGSAS